MLTDPRDESEGRSTALSEVALDDLSCDHRELCAKAILQPGVIFKLVQHDPQRGNWNTGVEHPLRHLDDALLHVVQHLDIVELNRMSGFERRPVWFGLTLSLLAPLACLVFSLLIVGHKRLVLQQLLFVGRHVRVVPSLESINFQDVLLHEPCALLLLGCQFRVDRDGEDDSATVFNGIASQLNELVPIPLLPLVPHPLCIGIIGWRASGHLDGTLAKALQNELLLRNLRIDFPQLQIESCLLVLNIVLD
mmetsp:Transcript_71050/g.179312  ORF Transcript_71050/g.179312 Transcript_71050/m.179312 type:complete len:250 (+) Transcript_71050:235-984(+)